MKMMMVINKQTKHKKKISNLISTITSSIHIGITNYITFKDNLYKLFLISVNTQVITNNTVECKIIAKLIIYDKVLKNYLLN